MTIFLFLCDMKRILIIEDEKPLARALELKLTHAGFETKNAANGEEGLALLKQESFDLILTDLMMPKVDGFAVLTALRERGNATPVIVLTNLSQVEDEKRARMLGAMGFFVKSDISVAEIVERIRRVFEESETTL